MEVGRAKTTWTIVYLWLWVSAQATAASQQNLLITVVWIVGDKG